MVDSVLVLAHIVDGSHERAVVTIGAGAKERDEATPVEVDRILGQRVQAASIGGSGQST